MSNGSGSTQPANAWNPGLTSDIPHQLWPKVTLFRKENAFVSFEEASELSELTGIKKLDLAAFRPQRLVVHNLLVRVTADLSVPDGPDYAELGLNLRGMVDTIYTGYMLPNMPQIVELFESEKSAVDQFVSQQLNEQLQDSPDTSDDESADRSFFARLFGSKTSRKKTTVLEEPVEIRAINAWKNLFNDAENPMHKASFKALEKTVGAIVGHRGKLFVDESTIQRIAVNQVCNNYVADVLDKHIEQHWLRAIDNEGYQLLPAQTHPVVMNVKGASASGKSTIRPQQRQLAENLNIPWEHFALISPDYWRKYLLDYESLNDDYKYGAMLTGSELAIIDGKLDRHMAEKAAAGTMSHMLIDRFRFDSFTLDIDRSRDSRLLSRFGDRVFLFFMVTPPAETVERAWERGLQTGRYKAVDDLLYHNVEAFTGMPSLFLSWVNSKDRQIHFEFLDNDVPEGDLPRTAAFGWNSRMTILDPQLLLNIDRYRQVDITATEPGKVLKQGGTGKLDNSSFILRCAEKVPELVFADQSSGEIYAALTNGRFTWWDRDYLEQHAGSTGLALVMSALGYTPERELAPGSSAPPPMDFHTETLATVGNWNRKE